MLAWYTLPLFAYGFAKIQKKNERLPAVIGLTFVIGYLLILATVVAGDASDRMKMRAFDVNRNGRIDDSEQTSEAGRAISAQSSDTGRALAPVLGIPLTLAWYTILFGILFGGEWAIGKLSPTSTVARQIPGTPDQRSE